MSPYGLDLPAWRRPRPSALPPLWTESELENLKAQARALAGAFDLAILATEHDPPRTREELNHALDAMLGRSLGAAVDRLNARLVSGPAKSDSCPPRGLRRALG